TDPQQAPVGSAFNSPLVAVVKDAAGNPASGASVTYAAPSQTGASATLSTTTVTSDSAGFVSVGATANSIAGSYDVTATLSGKPPVTFKLANVASGPAQIFIVSGTPQHTQPSTAFSTPLAVAVADALGNALPNVTVTFAGPASGASATFSSTTVMT